MTAALPMGAQKITGMADPTVPTDGATKNYVDTTTAAFFSTGDVKLTFKTVNDTGWIVMNDSTIGNAGSGAGYSNADALALYTLFWTNISNPTANAFATVTGGLGVSAAADWAGLKTMSLPRTLGRALAISGNGSSLTSRALGSFLGAEAVSLAVNQIPAGVQSSANNSISVASTVSTIGLFNSGLGGITASAGTSNTAGIGTSASATSVNSTNASQAISVASTNGAQAAVSIMQPTTFMNVMVKK